MSGAATVPLPVVQCIKYSNTDAVTVVVLSIQPIIAVYPEFITVTKSVLVVSQAVQTPTIVLPTDSTNVSSAASKVQVLQYPELIYLLEAATVTQATQYGVVVARVALLYPSLHVVHASYLVHAPQFAIFVAVAAVTSAAKAQLPHFLFDAEALVKA